MYIAFQASSCCFHETRKLWGSTARIVRVTSQRLAHKARQTCALLNDEHPAVTSSDHRSHVYVCSAQCNLALPMRIACLEQTGRISRSRLPTAEIRSCTISPDERGASAIFLSHEVARAYIDRGLRSHLLALLVSRLPSWISRRLHQRWPSLPR